MEAWRETSSPLQLHYGALTTRGPLMEARLRQPLVQPLNRYAVQFNEPFVRVWVEIVGVVRLSNEGYISTLMFNLTPLILEAQPIAERATEVYWRNTRPWFIGLLVHGSALKGGVVPNCSDIDLQLFLTPDAFDKDGYLPLSLSVDIHRGLAGIDPNPFQYIQCYALSAEPTSVGKKGSVGPFPNTYHMLAGKLPVPEATEKDALSRAHHFLANLQKDPSHASSHLLEHGGGRLERLVRFTCTDVWPALYNMIVLDSDDPLLIWTLTKNEAITLLKSDDLKQSILSFYQTLLDYYADTRATEKALNVIKQGVGFLGLVKAWYEDNQKSPTYESSKFTS